MNNNNKNDDDGGDDDDDDDMDDDDDDDDKLISWTFKILLFLVIIVIIGIKMTIIVYRFPVDGINDNIKYFNNDDNNNNNNSSSSSSRWVAIDLTLVVSLFHLNVAIHHAIANEKKGKMKTKVIQSEVKYYLSGSSKYSEAIQDYSINSNSTFIAFIYLNNDNNDSNNDDEINKMTSMINSIGGIKVDSNEINNNYSNGDNDKIDIILKVSVSINQYY